MANPTFSSVHIVKIPYAFEVNIVGADLNLLKTDYDAIVKNTGRVFYELLTSATIKVFCDETRACVVLRLDKFEDVKKFFVAYLTPENEKLFDTFTTIEIDRSMGSCSMDSPFDLYFNMFNMSFLMPSFPEKAVLKQIESSIILSFDTWNKARCIAAVDPLSKFDVVLDRGLCRLFVEGKTKYFLKESNEIPTVESILERANAVPRSPEVLAECIRMAKTLSIAWALHINWCICKEDVLDGFPYLEMCILWVDPDGPTILVNWNAFQSILIRLHANYRNSLKSLIMRDYITINEPSSSHYINKV